MSRLPDAVIERLKREVSLQRLAEARGIVLKAHGADLLGLCPFHADHDPSLVISPAKNLWHCLGACGACGTVIDWTMRAEGVSFRHAVELLQADYAPSAAAAPPPTPSGRLKTAAPVKRSTVVKLPAALSAEADDAELLLRIIDYYHAALKTSPEALAYRVSTSTQSRGSTNQWC
ncbi:MAG: CHC2 zinc finger domain-containing protein [Gammaproteobacteria bacterium]